MQCSKQRLDISFTSSYRSWYCCVVAKKPQIVKSVFLLTKCKQKLSSFHVKVNIKGSRSPKIRLMMSKWMSEETGVENFSSFIKLILASMQCSSLMSKVVTICFDFSEKLYPKIVQKKLRCLRQNERECVS